MIRIKKKRLWKTLKCKLCIAQRQRVKIWACPHLSPFHLTNANLIERSYVPPCSVLHLQKRRFVVFSKRFNLCVLRYCSNCTLYYQVDRSINLNVSYKPFGCRENNVKLKTKKKIESLLFHNLGLEATENDALAKTQMTIWLSWSSFFQFLLFDCFKILIAKKVHRVRIR